jgi:hypothetical protein
MNGDKQTGIAPEKAEAGGESGGGAYPNPRTGEGKRKGHGGQSENAYHGPGQLGDQDTDGEDQPNAPST